MMIWILVTENLDKEDYLMIPLMSMGINMWKENALIKMLGVVLLFTACNQTVYREVYINNNTSYDLNLYYETFDKNGLDSMLIDTGTECLIYSYSTGFEYASISISLKYIRLLYKDSLVYEQDPIDHRLWVYNHPGYYFTIIDSNLSVVGD